MTPNPASPLPFDANDRETIYRLIKSRRDIRSFVSTPVPDEVLERILEAAHHAPSVGFMQPWNFILIRSLATRQAVKDSYEVTNRNHRDLIPESGRQKLYRSLKLEGIMESALNIAITCDHRRDAPFVLGRTAMPETDLYSTCLAVQNLWLAARAEGVGVGWVSILDPVEVSRILGLPGHVTLVAYLCVGYPAEFRETPLLEEVGWKKRVPLKHVIFEEKWESPS